MAGAEPIILVVTSEFGAREPGWREVRPNEAVDLGPAGMAPPCDRTERTEGAGRHAVRLVRRGDQLRIEALKLQVPIAIHDTPIGAEGMRLADGASMVLGKRVFVVRHVSALQLRALEQESTRPFARVRSISPKIAGLTYRLRAWMAEDLILVGETGVGKEVFAHALHEASGRPGRFVAVNCACLPRELAESELFGFEKGSHSQAGAAKVGLVREASGGTLFLDELGEMPLEIQAKLLRFLQFREYVPLGATRPVSLELRVIAATSRLSSGIIRDDLRYRLGDPLGIVSLRERKEDIPALAEHCLACEPVREFSDLAFQALLRYSWPGNVRELEKVLKRAATFAAACSEAACIELHHLPSRVAGPEGYDGYDAAEVPPGLPDGGGHADHPAPAPGAFVAHPRRRSPRPRVPRDILDGLLREHGGRIADVARQLDRRWQVVWSWVKGYGIDVDSYRAADREKDPLGRAMTRVATDPTGS